MSTFESEEQAAEALANAVNQDAADRGDAPSVEQRAEQIRQEREQAATPADGSQQEQPSEDSFTNIDPSSLAPELQQIYRSMQADYTRGKQQVAEEARQYEALNEFGGPEAALEAAQFATALATDPQYALQVHESLSEALRNAGLTPREAAQEASRQMGEAAGVTQPDDDFDDIGFSEPESRVVQELQSKLDNVSSQLEQMNQWRANQEEIAMHQALDAEMDRQERRVFQAHPDWDDFDRERIYDLAYSTGGDLEAAADVWSATRQRLLDNYIEQKAATATNVPTPVGSGGVAAEAPADRIRDLFDPRLDALVNERLAELAAAES